MISTALGSWWRLARGDRPIGFVLLLAGTLWGLWSAARGIPEPRILLIFVCGSFLCRSAGCAINDYADRAIDIRVERTRHRPLATGELTPSQALWLAAILSGAAFGLLLLTDTTTIVLGILAALLATGYPFFKRFFHAPQLVLGLAFAWAVPMSYTAQSVSFDLSGWLLFAAVILWTVAYDTQYAMADRISDAQIGVRSLAVWLGKYDRSAIALLHCALLSTLCCFGWTSELGSRYYAGVAAAAVLFIWQQRLIWHRQPEDCLRAFTSNGWVGVAVFAGIAWDNL